MLDRVGTQLGSYRLLRLLGRGSTAEVYLGEHVYLKRLAALKVFHDRLVNEDIEQFIREAQTLSGLNHPHIVRVLDFAVQDHQPFLVTEYAPHGNLRTRYPGGKLVPLPELTSYVRQTASALQYAHEKELVHRDIKPENMLLGPQQELLLSDFGIAVFAPPPLAPYAQEKNQALVGTLPYMAPEQLQGQPQPASDQYALTIMIYEWLCGRRPFEGTPAEIVQHHLSTSPAPLRELRPDLSPALEELVLRALAKDPQQRFVSVSEFADAFLQVAHHGELIRAQITVPMSKNGGVPSAPEVFASAIVVQKQVPVEPITDPREATEAITGEDKEQGTGEKGVEEQPLWNVPYVFTSLLGREREITDICALLTSAGVRLVTLLGTGGIGKTRLSLQIASELRQASVDGVCFVALTAVSDPEQVLPAIAHELGLQEQSTPALEQVQEFLREKHMLLVLDNFEQVAQAAPSLEQMLAVCPGVKVLVTSRVVLRIPLEQQFWLSPLAVPDLQSLPESEAIAQYASVALFVQRARTLQPDFQVTQANAATLAEICARLDGLPLAIELAAARVKLLPPHALLPRLKNSLQVLTKGMPTQLTRQQTLRSAIQWSYDLLDPWEQRLFRLLSVFVGGFTLSAAEELSFALKEAGKESSVGVLDGVDSLIDKSLLQPPLPGEDEEPRLGMLETIREYGRERLAESGEMEAARRAHAAFYLQFAKDVSKEQAGAKQARWIKRLEQNYDNLRAAMAWMLEEGSEEQSVERVEMAIRLGTLLERFWRAQGYISEGWSFMERVLAKSKEIMPGVRSQAFITASILVGSLGDRNRAETLLEQSLAICRELGDTQRSAYCLRNLGWMAHVKGNFTRAQTLYEEGLGLFQELEDRQGIALSLTNMGFLAQSQGDYERAYRMFAEALAKFRELRDVHHVTGLLFQLAQLLYVSREQPPATEIGSLLNESIALAQELGDRGGIVNARALLGCLAFIEGDLVTARLLMEEVVPFYKSGGDRRGAGEWLAMLARIMTAQGDYSAASTLFDESLAIGREIGDRTEITTLCLEGMAHLATAQGLRVWAVRLWGAAEKVREETAFPMIPVERIPYQRSIKGLRAFFGEEVFSKLWAEGRTMSVEEAVSARFAPPPRPTAAFEPPVSKKKASAYPAGLSTREVEVLRLVARGLTDIEVAERLVLSSRTVSTHLSSIYNKLGINTRAAATRFAVEHHLV